MTSTRSSAAGAAGAASPDTAGVAEARLTMETGIETPEEPVRRRFEELPPAAQRALLEAEARRRDIDQRAKTMAREVDGRGGLEPTRYEDWEIKGIACDF